MILTIFIFGFLWSWGWPCTCSANTSATPKNVRYGIIFRWSDDRCLLSWFWSSSALIDRMFCLYVMSMLENFIWMQWTSLWTLYEFQHFGTWYYRFPIQSLNSYGKIVFAYMTFDCAFLSTLNLPIGLMRWTIMIHDMTMVNHQHQWAYYDLLQIRKWDYLTVCMHRFLHYMCRFYMYQLYFWLIGLWSSLNSANVSLHSFVNLSTIYVLRANLSI